MRKFIKVIDCNDLIKFQVVKKLLVND